MTAPLVWHDNRVPLSEAETRSVGPEVATSKGRAAIWADFPEMRPPMPPGQLWQREAKRDVLVHGEPRMPVWLQQVRVPTDETRRTARLAVAATIEERRPAMRAARAKREALSGYPQRHLLGVDEAARGYYGLTVRDPRVVVNPSNLT